MFELLLIIIVLVQFILYFGLFVKNNGMEYMKYIKYI